MVCVINLNRRYQHLTAEESSRARVEPKPEISTRKPTKSSFACSKSTSSVDPSCLYCNSNHSIFNCQGFATMPVLKRFEFSKGKGLCINCLHQGHKTSMCTYSKCGVCSKSHHTLLHRYISQNQSHSQQTEPVLSAQVNHIASDNEQSILATDVVKVHDRFGQVHFSRALLDGGSQANFITECFAQTLRLSRTNSSLTVSVLSKSNLVA